MRKSIMVLVVFAMVCGLLAFTSPPAAAKQNCVVCPLVVPICGPCETLVPQTCHRCATCKRIPGCRQ